MASPSVLPQMAPRFQNSVRRGSEVPAQTDFVHIFIKIDSKYNISDVTTDVYRPTFVRKQMNSSLEAIEFLKGERSPSYQKYMSLPKAPVPRKGEPGSANYTA